MAAPQDPQAPSGPTASRGRLPELFAREPFRLFFPAATLAGILGAALWPLHLLGISPDFPGQAHARIMAHGFFGGFILGFLCTAMPRMLSARPFQMAETGLLLLLHVAAVAAYAGGALRIGNALFLALLASFAVSIGRRIGERRDLPPPGFVLVALALGCAAVGSLLSIVESEETSPICLVWQKLLTYQGFILFPILGVGPFILPRFFGQPSAHDLPSSMAPTRAWAAKAALALGAGLVILGSFALEAIGWIRAAHAIRFAASLGYLVAETPLKAGPASSGVFAAAIRLALAGILGGFLAIAIFPTHRVGLLHLTLVGGFAAIIFVVATRVLFGHSGQLARLSGRNRWFSIAVGLMLFGMATRISGDFWPRIMASHYIYGALLWIGGVLLWAIFTLPKALVEDPEK